MQKQQLSLQQQALRLLQVQAARASSGSGAQANIDNKVTPANNQALLQNLMTAARNGQLDMNNPAFQQFRHIIMLQQQQKGGQVAKTEPGSAGPVINPNSGDSNGSAFMSNMPNVEQMIQQAVKSQQAVQQQPGYGQGHNGAGMGNGTMPRNSSTSQQTTQQAQDQQQQSQQQQQMPPNPRQNSGTDQPIVPPKIWTGDLTWPAGNGGCECIEARLEMPADFTQSG